MKPTTTPYTDQLRAYRKSKGWSQKEMADWLGCVEKTYQRHESGINNVSGPVTRILDLAASGVEIADPRADAVVVLATMLGPVRAAQELRVDKKTIHNWHKALPPRHALMLAATLEEMNQ